ncbi:MAG: hypothetical protein CMM21_03570 [Rhodospirillaceae bacterium]|jgi:sulfofructose kinase|nr:hypothetical protein [Rhodospirillaceae bacterium]|tara:strand:- start:2380 stop:3315 length:936 start_codon:yes stop_codon:yes gene_type:complete
MTSVICVGIATLDQIFQVESFSNEGGKTRAKAYQSVGGGIAANAAVAIARAGGQAFLATNLGDDLIGAAILKELKKDQIDASRVNIVQGLASPVASILINDEGERQIVTHFSPALFTSDLSLPDLPSACAAVMADIRWPGGACAALASAKKRGIPGVVDLEIVDDQDIKPFLVHASHIVVPRKSLERATGLFDPTAALQQLRQATDAHVSATLGPEGVIWLEGDTVQWLPALQIDVLDTTGAGDVFHGILAMELGRGRGFRDAATEANLVAALKCTRTGGRHSVPNSAQIETFKAQLDSNVSLSPVMPSEF